MTIPVFWWSPLRSARIARAEITSAVGAWGRVIRASRRSPTNFGDELSRIVVQTTTGRKVSWARPSRAKLLAVGSILELYSHAASGAAVWGTGLRQQPSAPEAQQIRSSLGHIAAVRGPLTRHALGLGNETPVGDPGILISQMPLGVEPGVEKLLLPHFRTWASPQSRSTVSLLVKRGYSVVTPNEDAMSVAAKIASAGFVATSSLHGLILSHALGVPAALIRFHGELSGESEFKYRDYHGSVGAELMWSEAQSLAVPLEEAAIIASAGARTGQLLEGSQSLVPALKQALVQVSESL